MGWLIIALIVVAALIFFYYYGKRPENNITKITMTQDLADLPKPGGKIGKPGKFKTQVVGVTFKNNDGSNRQSIIKKYAEVGKTVDLDFSTYKDDVACGVFVDNEKQIGNLNSRIAKELFNYIKKGGYADATISHFGKAEGTDKFGVGLSVIKVARQTS